MNFRNTLIMFLVLILLGGYVYIFEIQKHKEKEEQKALSEKIFHFVKDSVATLEIERPDGKIVIKKVQDEWKIVKPLETEADESIINTALTNLKDAKKDREFTINPQDLPTYGLGPDALTVRLTLTSGETDSLKFGDRTPVGSFVFACKSDSVVYTVNDYVKTAVDKKLFDWRDKRLVHFKREQLKKLVIHNPYGTFEFEMTGPNEWMLVNIKRPADSGKISGIISKLEYNRAKAFVDEEGTRLKEFGLSRPPFKIELFLGEERAKKTLLIGKKIKDKYYARDESRKPIFEIDTVLVSDINKPLMEFRGKDFAKVERDRVDRIQVQYGDTLITCLKDTAGNWFVDSLQGPKIKQYRMNGFMSDLDFANIKEFVADDHYTLSRYGLDKPALTVKLYDGEQLLLEARFGRKKGDQVYAMTDRYPSVYLLDAGVMKKLKLKREEILESPPQKSEEKDKPV